MQNRRESLRLSGCVAACVAVGALLCGAAVGAEGVEELKQQLQTLREQNQQLRQQLQQQQGLLDQLSGKVSGLEQARQRQESDLSALKEPAPGPGAAAGLLGKPLRFGNLLLSGEAGAAFFHQGGEGLYKNAEFRIDEAKLFLDAKVLENVYLFTELNLALREFPDDYLALGELYVDFEDVSRLWRMPGWLSVRAGRFDIPFGEEYRTRDAIDNPLISHSLSDIWGVDEGLALYGARGRFQYIAAVQSGGHPLFRDYDADKAVIARVGYDPAKWLHLSASAMRTGNLTAAGDQYSEVWFGNELLSATKPRASRFHVELVEGDARIHGAHGSFTTAGGALRYDDNDPKINQGQSVYYYYAEGVHDLVDGLYGAVRWSHILAPDGFRLLAAGNYGYLSPTEATTDLWRLSLGLGYRWNRNGVVKLEYSLERGRELNGDRRNQEDLLAAEVAVRF